ncbi:site-specific integrase [Herminiimonas fonticola]|uniref:Phage integrase family protein n=1 Tax=Herminiimonas fonticola TaxID=303380 RepID=A0A4V3BUJ1_9BURK|nr:site-specific integrase [Herminiimonas fonticola]RBA24354.1 hypothetical protein Hfont_2166 [Herminiimonas fonticola]TDN87298.1 hypothetical protein EV677_3009 [Herminiimonas fonticola]
MPARPNLNGIAVPNLSFPMVQYGGRETPWSLVPLLYSGGASADIKKVMNAIEQGSLGEALLGRLTLVNRLHQEICDDLICGGSRHTAGKRITLLRSFFARADKVGADLRLETVTENYHAWAADLLHRQLVLKEVSGATVYDDARVLSGLFGRVLGRQHALIKETRIHRPRQTGKFSTSAAGKVNLTETFKFGLVLIEICECLSFATTQNILPVQLSLHTGHTLEFWSGLQKPAIRNRTTRRHNHEARVSEEKRAAWQADKSLRTRSPLVNLRIEAELLLFIAQTGMNLQQAYTLRMDTFHYTSYLDGYQVRQHKGRREGSVLFEIFNEYRAHFEQYLDWRNAWFPEQDDGLLFPFITEGRSLAKAPEFHHVRQICDSCAIWCVLPRSLRKTRINWLLRRISDPQLVADMAQHDLQTLLQQYAEPNIQLAMVEISKFHAKTASSLMPPSPGLCVTVSPEPLDNMPDGAPAPDCVTGGGCLFCKSHRDVDSSDHVWSLVSFRHLKSIELAKYKPPKTATLPPHPAEMVVQRITQKIKFFESSSEVRGMWVRESLLCIDEGNYHPSWDGFIQLNEMRGSSE